MHLDGLDLNLLVALDSLLTEKSVTLAAEKLCVSQPAMSASLSKLRLRLGDQLLERVGRKSMLTPFGQEIAQPVRELILQIKATLDRRSTFDPENDHRSIKISMSGYCAKVFGVPVFRELSRRAPNVRCHIEEMNSDVFSRIQSSMIDYSINVIQSELHAQNSDPDSLDRINLFSDHFVLVADAKNEARMRGMDFRKFSQMRFVGTRQGANLVSLVERTLQMQMERPQIYLTVPSPDLAIDAVLGTDLVTIVPYSATRGHSSHGAIIMRDPPLTLPRLEETLTWHKRNTHDPFHIWFRAFMSEFALTWGEDTAQRAT